MGVNKTPLGVIVVKKERSMLLKSKIGVVLKQNWCCSKARLVLLKRMIQVVQKDRIQVVQKDRIQVVQKAGCMLHKKERLILKREVDTV